MGFKHAKRNLNDGDAIEWGRNELTACIRIPDGLWPGPGRAGEARRQRQAHRGAPNHGGCSGTCGLSHAAAGVMASTSWFRRSRMCVGPRRTFRIVACCPRSDLRAGGCGGGGCGGGGGGELGGWLLVVGWVPVLERPQAPTSQPMLRRLIPGLKYVLCHGAAHRAGAGPGPEPEPEPEPESGPGPGPGTRQIEMSSFDAAVLPCRHAMPCHAMLSHPDHLCLVVVLRTALCCPLVNLPARPEHVVNTNDVPGGG